MKKVLFLFLSITLFSCSKSSNDESVSPIVPIAPVTAIAYFKGSLGTQALDYTQNDYVTSLYGFSYYNGFQSGPGAFDKSYHYGCDIQPTTGSAQIGLTFNNLYNSNSGVSQTNAFYGLFTTIPTNFITNTQQSSLVKGIDVSYTSSANVNYSTLNGSQSGSTMTVTSSISGIESGGSLKIVTIIGTVNCKLYNTANPADVITLSNGTYKLIFREDF